MILHTYGADRKGHGVILNSSFDVVHEIKYRHSRPVAERFENADNPDRSKLTIPIFNMHELKILSTETSLTALHLTTRIVNMDIRELGLDEYEEA